MGRSLRLLCAMALVAVTCTAGGALGQEKPAVRQVELAVSAGFENHVRAPWAPLIVTVRNPAYGGEALRGQLVFEGGQQRQGFRSYRDVYLGPSAAKRITFYIPEAWGKVSFLVDGKSVSEVDVRGAGRYGWTEELLVVLSRRPGVLNFLEYTPRSAGTGYRGGVTRQVAQVSDAASMPDRWAGYSGVTAVILNDFELSRLSGPQQRALLGWVETGGRLIISPGPEARWLLQPPLDQLLGLQLLGNQEVRQAPTLERLYGAFEGEGKFLLHQLRSSRALFLGAPVGEWPSYVGVTTGAGVVVVIAFDVGAFPFRGWSGASAFWQAVLDNTKHGPRPSWTQTQQPGYPGQPSASGDALKVLSAMAAKTTSALLIVGLVGLYVLCVGPLNYLALRDYRRRVWLVVTTPLVALGFVVLVGTLGVLGRGISSLSQHLTLLTVCGDVESAYQRSYVGLWCPTSGAFDLEGSADAFIRPLVAGPQRALWQRVGAARFAERNVLEECQFRVNELRCFQVDAVRPLGGRLALRRDREGLVLENETDLDLRAAYIEAGGETILFGDVAAGESRPGRVRPSSDGRWSRTVWLEGLAPEWVPGSGVGPGRQKNVLDLLWSVVDGVTGMVVRSTSGRVYRLNAAVGNLEEPLRVRGGRVRGQRELVLLRAYLAVE